MLSEEAQIKRGKEIEQETLATYHAIYQEAEEQKSKLPTIIRRVNIIAGLIMLGLLVTSIPKIFTSVSSNSTQSKSPFISPPLTESPDPIPLPKDAQVVQLPRRPAPVIYTQIGDNLSISFGTGESGTIKYLARIDGGTQDGINYQIEISNAIQDLAAKLSLKEVRQPTLFREKLLKKLSNKKIIGIHVELSLELLKTNKSIVSIGDPLRF